MNEVTSREGCCGIEISVTHVAKTNLLEHFDTDQVEVRDGGKPWRHPSTGPAAGEESESQEEGEGEEGEEGEEGMERNGKKEKKEKKRKKNVSSRQEASDKASTADTTRFRRRCVDNSMFIM